MYVFRMLDTVIFRCQIVLPNRDPAAGAAQSVRAFAPQVEGLEFESQQRETLVVKKTGTYNCTAKRSAMGVSVTDPRR